MQLSTEDSLKLNVLLANSRAIRINEQTMCVFGLTDDSDAKVQLTPTCRPDKYIRLVREMLSTHVLGSPGGYPIYLRRWTRMGDMHNTRLQPLLMLGEDEAVIAVARAPALTDELAACIWWALPTAEVARYMLQNPTVVSGKMGPILADYLVEYLPFEQSPGAAIETVRLILQPALIDASKQRQIWQQGRRKNYYYVGFLQAIPDQLPEPANCRDDYSTTRSKLDSLINNPVATQLLRLYSSPGQTFLRACEQVLRKPVDQDVVVTVLDAIYDYFRGLRADDLEFSDVDALSAHINDCHHYQDPPSLAAVLRRVPNAERDTRALMFLAHIGEPIIRPIFARTDAVGSVMRKRIAPVIEPTLNAIAQLQGPKSETRGGTAY